MPLKLQARGRPVSEDRIPGRRYPGKYQAEVQAVGQSQLWYFTPVEVGNNISTDQKMGEGLGELRAVYPRRGSNPGLWIKILQHRPLHQYTYWKKYHVSNTKLKFLYQYGLATS